MADRFYCPNAAATTPSITLEGDEARHLSRVRRVEVGEIVEVFDGRNFATLVEVLALGKDRVELRAVGNPLPGRGAPCFVSLATAVPKGDRFDWLVEKATELGVGRIIPILTERSTVDPRGSKLDRLRRTVIEASKQCGRNRLMTIDEPTSFAEILRSFIGHRMLCHPSGASLPSIVGSAVRTTYHPPDDRTYAQTHVNLAVGPEGGFSEEEVVAARNAGWTIMGLGETLLRVETAGIVACARVLAVAESSGISRGGTTDDV